jgi:alginate O-acetyltransferase complex protein AlgI
MLGTIVWAFVCALAFRRPTTLAYVVSGSIPMLVLFLFKYLDFTISTFGISKSDVDFLSFIFAVTLPAGISFYTFEVLSYSIDVLDKKIPPERSMVKLTAFVSAYPHLIAGPILRYHELSAQLDRLATDPKVRADFVSGFKFLSFGLFAKIFFSDVLASFARVHFNIETNTSSPDALYYILSYSFRIYFDFWAYSIMAIGLGRMIGLDLPRNFREPYMSLNPREFWRRWHITLSFWLRDYVYLRMGGKDRYVRNIVVVFLACGLWHGAGWNFVLWGAYHAALVIGYHYAKEPWSRLPEVIQRTITFALVSFGWPLFNVGVDGYFNLMAQVFQLSRAGTSFGLFHWGYLFVIAIVVFGMREDKWVFNIGNEKQELGKLVRSVLNSPVIHACLTVVAVLFLTYRDTFIYFRF